MDEDIGTYTYIQCGRSLLLVHVRRNIEGESFKFVYMTTFDDYFTFTGSSKHHAISKLDLFDVSHLQELKFCLRIRLSWRKTMKREELLSK